MFKYYRMPLVATVIIFGAIQFYGSGEASDQAVSSSRADGAKQPASSTEMVDTESAHPTPQPQSSEPGNDSATAGSEVVEATSSTDEIIQTFSGQPSGATKTAQTRDVDDVFAALQKAMDGDIASSTAASPTVGTAIQQSTDNTLQSMGRMLMSLAFVILLGLGLAWFVKKYLGKRVHMAGGMINHISSYAISPKSKVHLIQVGNERFLVGEASNSLSLISRIDSGNLLPEEELGSNGSDESQTYSVPGFNDRLSEWQHALDNQTIGKEVSDSMQLFGGLANRLRRKKVEGHE